MMMFTQIGELCRKLQTFNRVAFRDVTATRQPFPSFCPEDFELAQSAAQRALKLAQAASQSAPDSQVLTTSCALPCQLSQHTRLPLDVDSNRIVKT